MFGHGREVCHLETALAALILTLVVRHYFAFWKRLPDVSGVQAMLSCLTRSIACSEEDRRGQRPHACRPLFRPFEGETPRRRKLCEDYKKALTSELAAKRMKTGKQLARIDGVDTKRLRETLSKEMLAY